MSYINVNPPLPLNLINLEEGGKRQCHHSPLLKFQEVRNKKKQTCMTKHRPSKNKEQKEERVKQ